MSDGARIGDGDSILWRFLLFPGHEHARLAFADGLWRLEGVAAFAHEGRPCRFAYGVECDEGWRTVRASVEGWMGTERVEMEIAARDGQWTLDGNAFPQVEGCVDVDLGFTPSTNLLPIRRLGLAVGEAAEVRAAWLRFPDLTFGPLEQVYRRTGERTYRYESGGGAFTAELEVNAAGLVTRYGDFWVAEANLTAP